MHETIIVVGELTFGVGYLGLPGSYASSCVPPVYVAGQRKSSPGLMLGLLVMSSHGGTCGGRRSLLFRSDLSSVIYLQSDSFWPWMRACGLCSCVCLVFGLPALSLRGGGAGRYCGIDIAGVLVLAEPVFPSLPFFLFISPFCVLLGTLWGFRGDEVDMDTTPWK